MDDMKFYQDDLKLLKTRTLFLRLLCSVFDIIRVEKSDLSFSTLNITTPIRNESFLSRNIADQQPVEGLTFKGGKTTANNSILVHHARRRAADAPQRLCKIKSFPRFPQEAGVFPCGKNVFFFSIHCALLVFSVILQGGK